MKLGQIQKFKFHGVNLEQAFEENGYDLVERRSSSRQDMARNPPCWAGGGGCLGTCIPLLSPLFLSQSLALCEPQFFHLQNRWVSLVTSAIDPDQKDNKVARQENAFDESLHS